MKNSGIEWIGDIPAEWNIVRIGAQYTERKTKVSDTEYPPLSVTMKGILPQLATAAKTDAHDDRKLVCKGDFAINSRSDRRGSCGISEYDGSVSLINTILCPRDKMNPQYYGWLFHSTMFSDEFYKWGHGIVDDLWTTNWQDMKHISIPEPSLEEQQKIADFLDRTCAEIDAVIEKTKATIEEYKKLKQSVITEAVTKGIRGDRPMKDSGIEWIGEIPADWQLVKLKYISEQIGDGIHTTPQYDVDGEYYFLNGNSIGKDCLIFKENTDKLNCDEYEKYKKPFINANTIMITLNGATYGKTSFYNNEKVLLGKSAGYITLRANTNRRFIRYYLQSHSAYKIMEVSLCGTTIQNLSLTTLRNFPTPFPKSEEQNQIADYLDKKCAEIDTLIAKKTTLLEEMENYKKSVIYEYVTGKKEVM